jgi:hypothetical protein
LIFPPKKQALKKKKKKPKNLAIITHVLPFLLGLRQNSSKKGREKGRPLYVKERMTRENYQYSQTHPWHM